VSARVIFYTRQGCHLCDEARPIVAQTCAEERTPWQEVDIDTVPGLALKYGEMAPVVTVDGVEQGFWTIDADRLRLALR